jgi:glycosyltransferase involved in cell wall biosynthesis
VIDGIRSDVDSSDLPVTVVIPVKNEERNLPRCLAALRDFRHVIIVDSGSADQTREIASRAGAQLIDFSWDGKFPKKRNWVLMNHQFSTPWVLFIDADEHVTGGFVEELRRVLPDSKVDGFWLNYTNYFLDRELKYGIPQRKLALFRVGAGLYERIDESRWSHLDMEVHEHPILLGDLGEIRARIEHRDFRGLEHFITRHNAYSSWEAHRFLQLRSQASARVGLTSRQITKYRHLSKWWYAPAYFLFSYFLRLGFRDGRPGLVYNLFKMFYFVEVREKIIEAGATERATPRGSDR